MAEFQSETEAVVDTGFAGKHLDTLTLLRMGLYEKFYPVVSPFPQDRPPPQPPIELEEAEIRWGKASNFAYSSRQGPHLKYTLNVDWGNEGEDGEEPEEEEMPTLTYTEAEEKPRKVSKLRVVSDDDPDIWLEVERIDEITFKGPASLQDQTQVYHHFVLKNPPAPGS